MREASSFFMYLSVQPLMLMAGNKKIFDSADLYDFV
jgi:hypothetical protein